MNSIALVEQTARDARYAARVLRRSPAFTLTAVLTLATAIGINVAVFTVVDAVLLEPLPYPDPGRLVLVATTVRAEGVTREELAQHGLTWETVRDHATAVDAAPFSTWPTGVNLVSGSTATHVRQQRVGAEFFAVLGVRPALGRTFTSMEDRTGGPGAVVLSHHLWRRDFGGDPAAIGRSVVLRGEPAQVVGVMPAGFRTDAAVDLWTPLRASRAGEGAGENYAIAARLRPGATLAQAQQEMARLGEAVVRQKPPADGSSHAFSLVPMQRGLTGAMRRPLLMVWGAVAVVLTIACVNLSGLMLARGSARRREIATRLALGSGRAAVLRQLIVESLVLALAGGAGGILLGAVGLDVFRSAADEAFALSQPIALNGRAMLVALGLSMLASVTFGTGPALAATRLDLRRGLDGSRTATAGRTRARASLAVAQVALGLVLLVAAGFLVRSYTHLRGLQPGFDPSGVVIGTVSLEDARYRSAADVQRLFAAVVEGLQNTPGVYAAAVSLGVPYERLLNLGFRRLDGGAGAEPATTSATYVAGDYFRALRVPLLAGRPFDRRDQADGPGAAIVSETFARMYLGVSSGEYGRALGARIAIAGREREVVGITGDVQVRPGWGDYGPLAPMPLTYLPAAQLTEPFLRLVHGWFSPAFVVRGAGAPLDRSALARALAAADPLLPLASVRPMEDVQGAALAQPRLLMTLLGVLATAAVVLAAIGIHGLTATAVTERTREIGIRLALGATAAKAVRAAAMPGIWLAVSGVAIGLLPALAFVRLARHLIWGISETDPATFAAAALGLLAVAAIASVVPALRILTVDPAATLRHE